MAASPTRNAYEILGVPKTATTDEIKRKYRELARKYHPDLNGGNPAAAKTFSEVTDAYKTLSDADTRAVYDADLSLKERQAAQVAARAQARASAPGYGGSARPAAGSATPNRAGDAARLVAEARNAFQRGKFLEARTRAEQAIRLTSRNAEAYEILGDVYRVQGKSEQAMNMYSMSLQINPRNYSVMQRLERVSRDAGGPASPTAQGVYFDNRPSGSQEYYGNPGYSPTRPSGGLNEVLPEQKRNLGRLLVGFFGYAGVFLLVLFVALFGGEAPRGTPVLGVVSTWNGSIITALVLSGAMLGATMTITGAIRRIDDELMLGGGEASVRGGRGYFPIGILMVVGSLFSFWLAAAAFAIYAVTQEAFTRSMQRVFSAVALTVLALACVYTPGFLQVLLWGGNVAFLAFVIGWLLGDFFRGE